MDTTKAIELEIKKEKDVNTSKSRFKKFLRIIGYALVWTFVLSLALGALTAAIWTFIPTSLLSWGSNKTNILGYVSHCPFTPFSTIILLVCTFIGFIFVYKITKGRIVGLGMFIGIAGGMSLGALGGFDIGIFMGMGAGVGIGFVFGLVLGMFREKEI